MQLYSGQQSTLTRPIGRSVRVNVVNLIGGGGRGAPGGAGRGGRGGRGGAQESLYIPGSPQQPRQPQKIVIPGQKPTSGGGGGGKLIMADQVPKFAGGVLTDEDTITTLTGPGSYRPPAGFMNEDGPVEDITANMTPDQMLKRLRSRAGQWHELAKFFISLYKQQYDSNIIDEMTGITPAEQNKWAVASTVYDSVKADAKVGPKVLEHFESMNGAGLMYPFRFLTNDARNIAMDYVYAQNLDEQMCEVLARSMKEWERRESERMGFEYTPPDCLAFKFMRDALELRKPEDVIKVAGKAMKYAQSEGAKARIQEVIQQYSDVAPLEVTASLLMLRVSVDEVGQRPMPLLGVLGQVEEGDVEAAPRTTQDGPFAAFTITGSLKYRWVMLPQWKALIMARHPIAMEVKDLAGVEAVLQGTKVKNDDDRKRLKGPGLIVADRASTPCDALDPNTFYLSASMPDSAGERSAKVRIVDGATLKHKGADAIGTVLFAARPPVRDGLESTGMMMQG